MERYAKSGFDMESLVDVVMEPGDLALWGPFTVHGGGINTTSDNARRLYINGYAKASDTDRGEPTLEDGRPLPLDSDNPAVIQFDAIHEKPGPFYPELDDRAARFSD